jgi:hypothetical protein
MTATNDGQTKGGDESSKKDITENDSQADPGSLAERPMGDHPPPKNEDLADETAPTFKVNCGAAEP